MPKRRVRFKIALIPEKRIAFLAEMKVLSLKQLAEDWEYEYIYLSRILSGDRCMTDSIWNNITTRTSRVYEFFDVVYDDFNISRRKQFKEKRKGK